MLNKKKLLALLLGVVLYSFASSSEMEAVSTTPDQVVGNKGSVASSNMVDVHYALEILKTGIVGNQYVRVAAIKLDNIPVIVAVSKTNLNNKTFLNIMKNAGGARMGPALMAIHPQIKYRNQIDTITVAQIKTPVVKEYLASLGYGPDKKVTRKELVFIHQQEVMTLTEFILPNDEE